jgi:hypothetical protein
MDVIELIIGSVTTGFFWIFAATARLAADVVLAGQASGAHGTQGQKLGL